jgi:ZIP family zinc transporter
MVHGVVAFGGGILVAAVAFALAPEAMQFLSPATLATTFVVGGIAFCVLDAQLGSNSPSKRTMREKSGMNGDEAK